MTKQQRTSTYTPYCYLIGWKEHNIFYYGVKYGKDANPDDLWLKYKTSSDYVRQFTEEHGEPDIIQVRKTFKSGKEALKWESLVLSRIKAVSRDDFLNRCNISLNAAQPKSIETRLLLSKAHTGKILSEAHKRKIAKSCEGYGSKSITLHSKALNKSFTFDSRRHLMYTWGITSHTIRCMREEGQWVITKRFKTTKWPFPKGDIITML